MTTKKRPRRLDTTADESPTCDDLTREQKEELVSGPRGDSAFGSDEDRRREWLRHRHVILHSSTHGIWGGPYVDKDVRPWAWWRHEHEGDGPPAEYDQERFPWPWRAEGVELHWLGELSPRAELQLWQQAEDRWRGTLASLRGRAGKDKPEEKREIARLERVLEHVERGSKAAEARRG